MYARGGFVINTVLMNQEFDKIVDEVPKIEINITAAREHVGEIERVYDGTVNVSNKLDQRYCLKPTIKGVDIPYEDLNNQLNEP